MRGFAHIIGEWGLSQGTHTAELLVRSVDAMALAASPQSVGAGLSTQQHGGCACCR